MTLFSLSVLTHLCKWLTLAAKLFSFRRCLGCWILLLSPLPIPLPLQGNLKNESHSLTGTHSESCVWNPSSESHRPRLMAERWDA